MLGFNQDMQRVSCEQRRETFSLVQSDQRGMLKEAALSRKGCIGKKLEKRIGVSKKARVKAQTRHSTI